MKKTILIVLTAFLGGQTVFADDNPANSIGIEPTYTYKAGLNEVVNLFNGNLNVQVPLLKLKGRAGFDLDLTLSYNSRQFRCLVGYAGHKEIWENYTGTNMGRWVPNFYPYVTEWTEYHEDSGMTDYHAEATLETGAKIHLVGWYPHGNSADYNMEYNFDSHTLSIKNSGVWYKFSNYLRPRKGDANGNYIDYIRDTVTYKFTQIADSLGRTVNFYYDSSDTPYFPTRMTVLNNAGVIQTYSFEYQNLPIQAGLYGYNYIYVPESTWMLTKINLPDGKAWTFSYYPGGGYPTPCGTFLKQIDYPMGGYSRYEYRMWTDGSASFTNLDLCLWKKFVNANNGQGEITTTYTCSAYAWVYNPDGSQEQHIMYSGGPESFFTLYDAAGTTLRADYKQWTYLDGIGNRLTYKDTKYHNSARFTWTSYGYDGSDGNLITESTGGTTSFPPHPFPYEDQPFLRRKTTRTYQKIMVTRPGQQSQDTIFRLTEEAVNDQDWSTPPNYTLVSKTRYAYDQFALTDRAGTIAGHDSNYGTTLTGRGNLTTVSRWLAGDNRYIDTKTYYDILGNVVQKTDSRNYSTTTSYSSASQFAYATQVVNPKNQTVSMTYAFNTGQLLSITDANSKTTIATLDSLNRTTRIDAPDGSYTRVTYDLTANNFSTTVYKSVATGLESATTTYLDGIGRQWRKKVSDPAGDIYQDTIFSVCDCQGKTSKVSNPYRLGEAIYWTETQYDALGRKAKIIPPDGTSSSNYLSYSYDLNSPMMTVTDAAGKSKKYDYDPLMRIWRVTEPDSSNQLTLTTSYNYMPSGGQPGLVMTQGSQTRTFVYDTLGRVVSETHPENGTTTYLYDDSSNLTRKTDARGMITNYTYDELNRMTGKTYQNDGGVTLAVTMTYDAGTNGIGRLSSWSGGTTSSGLKSYDLMGRTLSDTRTIDTVTHSASWSYSLGGQVLTSTYPDSSVVTNGFDTIGNLETITSTLLGSVVTNVDRDGSGSWAQVNYGNGVANNRSFNTGHQLASIRISTGGTNHFYKTYGYNAGTANNGRIASIADNLESTKTVNYTYDELNRLLTAATSGTDWGLSWSYDRYGNRLSQTVTKGTAPGNTLSISTSTNRVTTWTYDAAGNVTDDGRNSYVYDAENRVVSINSGATTYLYDAFGSRVEKTTGSTVLRYFFGMAEKTDSSWTKILVATPAGTAEWDNGAVIFRSNDHLGNARVITNSSGSVTGRLDLFPYGEVQSETGTTTKYKLTGKERDSESGNDYFGARSYWNDSGRWQSVDPVLGKLTKPQRLNRYTYVLNDPVNFIDPDGRFECASCYDRTDKDDYFDNEDRDQIHIDKGDHDPGGDGPLGPWNMNFSSRGLNCIKSYESLSLSVYNDPAGKATIGYGHLLKPGEDFSGGITVEKAVELLKQDANEAIQAVRNQVKVAITQDQFDALVSFTFNVGPGGLAASTLLKNLNSGNPVTEKEFTDWNKAGGTVFPGLTNRRKDEYNLFANGKSDRCS